MSSIIIQHHFIIGEVKTTNNTIGNYPDEIITCNILIQNASCFVDGTDTADIFENLSQIKASLLNNDDIEVLFLVSLLNDVLIRMHSKSI